MNNNEMIFEQTIIINPFTKLFIRLKSWVMLHQLRASRAVEREQMLREIRDKHLNNNAI